MINFPIFVSIFFLIVCPFGFAKDHTAICGSGEHWVSAHNRRAYYRADGTFVSATSVSAHCRKNSRGYEFWKPKLKPGFPTGWLRNNEKTKAWTDEEKERVLEALDSIPEFLWVDIEGIYRMEKDASGQPNPASRQGGKIVLYDAAFKKNTNLSHVLAHELSHEFFDNLTPQQRAGYAAAGDWQDTELFGGHFYMRGRPKGSFVQPDGATRIEEDFSNNIEYFLFRPQALKKSTPKVYEWIKKNYGDKLKLKAGGV